MAQINSWGCGLQECRENGGGEIGSREEITQEEGLWTFLYSLKFDCQTQELFEYTKVQKENPLLLVFKVSQDP